MKRDHWMRVMSAMLVIALTAVLNPAWAAAEPATLSGRVLAEDSRTPLAGAVVQLTGSSERAIASEVTGEDGLFELAGLEPGVYRVVVETEAGLFQVAASLRLEAGQARSVQMALKTDRELVAGSARGGGGAVSDGGKVAIGFGILLGTFAIVEALDDDKKTKRKQSPSDPDPS